MENKAKETEPARDAVLEAKLIAAREEKGLLPIPAWLWKRLYALGIIPNEVREMNVGESDYSEHLIQPWAIWIDWQLNPWDADIVKRVVRHKATDPRRLDYEKIIHICQERIRQIEAEEGSV